MYLQILHTKFRKNWSAFSKTKTANISTDVNQHDPWNIIRLKQADSLPASEKISRIL
jgi:hypothetical protein